MSLLKRFFNTLIQDISGDILPPLEAYAPPEKPTRMKRTDVQDEGANVDTVIGGHAYSFEQIDSQHFEMSRVGSVPESPAKVTLDRFDLSVLYARKGEKDQKALGMYRVIKWHWLQEQSAGTIEQLHTSKATGQTVRGFSKRSVAEYISMLYEADNDREKEGEKRLRSAPKQSDFEGVSDGGKSANTPPPSNAIEL